MLNGGMQHQAADNFNSVGFFSVHAGAKQNCRSRVMRTDHFYRNIKGTELEFVIMVIAVSCVKLLSAHNSTQHTSRKHKV
jgi:hypothetical protein